MTLRPNLRVRSRASRLVLTAQRLPIQGSLRVDQREQ